MNGAKALNQDQLQKLGHVAREYRKQLTPKTEAELRQTAVAEGVRNALKEFNVPTGSGDPAPFTELQEQVLQKVISDAVNGLDSLPSQVTALASGDDRAKATGEGPPWVALFAMLIALGALGLAAWAQFAPRDNPLPKEQPIERGTQLDGGHNRDAERLIQVEPKLGGSGQE